MSARRSKEGTFDRPFTRAARWLIDHGVKPNHVTILQLPVFFFMVEAALDESRWVFFGLSWILVLLDGADGIVARVGGMASRAGAFMDAAFDTVGIAIVLWGAAHFHPDLAWVWITLFVLNFTLYLQNLVLHEKVVSYVRGPAIVAIALPDVVWLAAIGSLSVVVWLLVTRVPGMLRQPPTPG